MWAGFFSVVLMLLALDLGVFNRTPHAIGTRESLIMSAWYIVMGLAFGVWVWISLGAQAGSEYFTGFLVEKTLALDNIFVISLIFAHLAIPAVYQHRVLFWGILGVIVLRAVMIGLGAALVSEFSWILYLFALFLVATGFKMLLMEDKPPELSDNPVLKLIRLVFRVTPEPHKERFFVRLPDERTGRVVLWATPLFVALLMIEIVDLIFAVDSIPAIFAITTDPFVVYTSNIFAILGLRALYFALASAIDRFRYLKPALAVVLIFIGAKIFIADALGWEKFPASVSLAVTLAILAVGLLYSVMQARKEAQLPS
ncbi:MAG TPA: TerC family protein [Hyphomicrobium zavarzinii]|jgi:tellurite resistance protein TerC|nr:TerC family protein [Hyphomicrobium sp. DMF-1]WBT40439.1 TerC family protein [Hyphomicrobium sp. DMF-1]HML41356.1 TerC family protein [Hyphomicrobium zavarzinii]